MQNQVGPYIETCREREKEIGEEKERGEEGMKEERRGKRGKYDREEWEVRTSDERRGENRWRAHKEKGK